VAGPSDLPAPDPRSVAEMLMFSRVNAEVAPEPPVWNDEWPDPLERNEMLSLTTKCGPVLSLLLVAGSGYSFPSGKQDLGVRELVAREAAIEMSAWNSFIVDLQPEQITLESLESTTRGVLLWEARPPVDHWHRYVVAQRGNHLWRLGGFAENDLVDFYNVVQRASSPGVQQSEIGRYLIGLADPNGGERIYPTGQTSHVALEWLARRSPNWPADTVYVRADGSSVHRLTVLSKVEHSYGQPWVPMVFTFSFDPDGFLSTWHRREGAQFHVTLRTTAP